MKKMKFLITAGIIVTGFAACNGSNDAVKLDADNFTMYVDSVETAPRVYTEANWTEIENGYQNRAAKADQSADKFSAEQKTNTDASKAKFAALKADYEAKMKEKEDAAKMAASSDYRLVLRNSLFGEGKIGSDMKFAFVNAGNILNVYKSFVDKVDDNKDKYTREDWDEVKVLYEALDNRKNVVEKEGLSSADNLKIAGLKIKFAAIKATHRGVSKIEENAESKQ